MSYLASISLGQNYSDLAQSLPNINYFGYFIYLLIATSSLAFLLPYDNIAHTVTFSSSLVFILAVLQHNAQCAKTANFLIKLVLIQIIMLSFVYRVSKILGKIKLLPHYKNNQHQYSFAVISVSLFIINGIGFVYCLYHNYHSQLYNFPVLISMCLMVLFGFFIVFLCDFLYVKWMGDKMKMSTRRKIFHFVPVGLLPVLVNIDYRLFTLMVFGAFYLFWLLEIIRYFCKLTKKQSTLKEKIGMDESKDKLSITSNVPSFIKEIMGFYEKYFAELPFIQWMEQLNSAREKYFWFTHLSLILGLSLTYIYYINLNYPISNEIQIEIKQNISIILVIGDAMAAIIGRKYGKSTHIIPYTNNKTFEGFIGFVSTVIAIQFSLYFGLYWIYEISLFEIDVIFIIMSGILCAAGELFSGDMDNIVTGIIYIGFDYIYHSFLSP